MPIKNELLLLVTHGSKLYPLAVFLFKTKLHKTSHRLPLYGQDWINFMCINELLR